MINFNKEIECTDCPCLNKCNDCSYTCNLESAVDLKWNKVKKLIYCSKNCKLISILFTGGQFKPMGGVEVTDVDPINW